MKRVFDEVGSLDKKCYEQYGLTEDVLMEHAASSMMRFCESNFNPQSKILIVSGPGNNGADGIALARQLQGLFEIDLYLPFGVKSPMAHLQLERAVKVGVQEVRDISSYDVVVDSLFGSGLSRELNETSQKIIQTLNELKAYKLCCDIPSGILLDGSVPSVAFKADKTLTMGAYKSALFSDGAKEYIGEIEVVNLGVQASIYEDESSMYLLEPSDMKLPHRIQHNTHKGSFGHAAFIIGQKMGAGKLACEAAFKFGAGLVSAIAHQDLSLPYHIMQSHKLPKNTTAFGLGMGLGKYETKEIESLLEKPLPKVIDADLFYEETILKALNEQTVLTPHPKEFVALLKQTNIADITVSQLQENRIKYVKAFMRVFTDVTLLLKGANTLIAHKEMIYINPYGSASLSKGGSGDVLTGLITALLAQGYQPLDAAINASLAHTLAIKSSTKNSYALTPYDIIEGITTL